MEKRDRRVKTRGMAREVARSGTRDGRGTDEFALLESVRLAGDISDP